MDFDISELVRDVVNEHFDHPMAIAEAGAWIIGFYLVIFLALAIVRGKFKPVRDGNVYRIGPMFASWLKIPAGFMGVNLIAMLIFASCATEYPDYRECGPREDFCFECIESVVVATTHGLEGDVHWLPTLANAYGVGVLIVQTLVVPGVLALVMVGFLSAIGKFVLYPTARLIFTIISFLWGLITKIPIRL